MEYQYNIIWVDSEDIVRAITFSKDRLPTNIEEMFSKHDVICKCCNQLLKLKKLVLAGNYEVGKKY